MNRATPRTATPRSATETGPPTDLAIEATALTKTFGSTVAVNCVDLAVPRGGVYGVLGPNGAGKTTTMRMLATLTSIDGGSARVLGHDVATEPDAVRSAVSLTGQFASLDEDLTGWENLVLLSRLYGYSRPAARERADLLLQVFDLSAAASKQVKTYSGGMRRRVDIAAGLVVTPELMFLDEPTTGLDPRSRNQVWEIVRSLVAGGTTVLLTTQYLDEADQLADRVAVIDSGRVIAEGTTGQLKASVGSGSLHVRVVDSATRPEAARILRETLRTDVVEEPDPAALTSIVDDTAAVARGLTALHEAGIEIGTYALGQPSLDEVFLALTGRPTEQEESSR